ncbi:efflux RND transporter permease subunit [Bernardetia litoralis]|uniref:efflux RND transporter permease subunit n=1 Tax=Bernardetia litoralis TaxID=999 RepID=UPI0002FEC4E0|nr:CusA/CzcA family heavy metal efflux RND transporter [Bernardetia litoralis]
MLDNLIGFSIRNKFIVFMGVLALIGWGTYSLLHLPLDAVPDITNNQVQIVTQSPTLAPQEVERFITAPVEISMANLPNVIEVRSVSKYGLSVVTIVFKEDTKLLEARQLVSEQLTAISAEIPAHLGTPSLMPITTGLGEVYQYTLKVEDKFKNKYSITELRTIQDWIVKRQMAGVEGIVEVSSFGGNLKQYEVAVNPSTLQGLGITLNDIYDALASNNANGGGSYIEKTHYRYYVRTEGLINIENTKNPLKQIQEIPIKVRNSKPILIGEIAEVKEGFAPRLGAMTQGGTGEAVGGIVLMLKGGNSSEVIKNIEERVKLVQKALPEGVSIVPYLERSDLIGRAIATVSKNLAEGALIVIFVLVLLLGNFRAGFIVASVIPLALMFAFGMMNLFGVSANLMSLGAIDFGLIVDGSVIIVENVIHQLYKKYKGQKLTSQQMDNAVLDSSLQIRQSAAFGEIIILMVYLPILALTGVEGKMFKPMAETVIFAILGAFILSLTYVPMMSAWLLSKNIKEKHSQAERISNSIMQTAEIFYIPILVKSLQFGKSIVAIFAIIFGLSLYVFLQMGGEFIPTLEEGDFAMQLTLSAGSSLKESIKTSTEAEQILIKNFPNEVRDVVSKIGTAEIPTDPMSIENADIMILLYPKSEWKITQDQEELVIKMKESLEILPHAEFEFTQPIQLRFNELITGDKSDIAIRVFGESLDTLYNYGQKIGALSEKIEGVGDVRVEQIVGLPQFVVEYDRPKLAQYGITIDAANRLVETAFAGGYAGTIYEGEKRFDLVVRLSEKDRNDPSTLENLFITIPSTINTTNQQIPLNTVAKIKRIEGAAQISRENTQRKLTVGINVRGRDVESLVNELSKKIDTQIKLPAGYLVTYGGQFENLQAAKARLMIAVPVALLIIFALLFITFGSLQQATLIFTAIPLSAIGGVWALWLRDMPFSISAGVGFIALFGVAVLNGIVLIARFNDLKKEDPTLPLKERIIQGTKDRLRPVLMTALTAALGFLPMAISTAAGAEVQKPLATVVIGGLITATVLTLIVLPILYGFLEGRKK